MTTTAALHRQQDKLRCQNLWQQLALKQWLDCDFAPALRTLLDSMTDAELGATSGTLAASTSE